MGTRARSQNNDIHDRSTYFWNANSSTKRASHQFSRSLLYSPCSTGWSNRSPWPHDPFAKASHAPWWRSRAAAAHQRTRCRANPSRKMGGNEQSVELCADPCLLPCRRCCSRARHCYTRVVADVIMLVVDIIMLVVDVVVVDVVHRKRLRSRQCPIPARTCSYVYKPHFLLELMRKSQNSCSSGTTIWYAVSEKANWPPF